MSKVYTAAESELHKAKILSALKTVVNDLTGIDPEHVDINANFMEVGIDSLMLIQATQLVKELYDVKLSVVQLLEQLTNLDALASYIARELPPESLPEISDSHENSVVISRAEAPPATTPPVTPVQPQQPPAPAAYTQPIQTFMQEVKPAAREFYPVRAMNGGPSSPLDQIMSQQLQLMARQLDMLHASYSTMFTPAPIEDQAPLAHAIGESNSVTATAPAPAPEPNVIKQPVYTPYQPIEPGPTSGLTETQQRHLDHLIARFNSRTRESKRLTQEYRPYLSDSRSSFGFRLLWKELVYPIIADHSSGSKVWDVDGNEYVDVSMGFGVHLFGHSPGFVDAAMKDQIERKSVQLGPQVYLAGKVARLFSDLTGQERVNFCNSGTEAVMAAMRLARTVTQRSKIATFGGAYHGWSDLTLAKNGSGKSEGRSVPIAPGISAKTVEDLVVLDWDSPTAIEYLKEHIHELAAVMVEPVQSRRPDIQPREFLHQLRELTASAGTALIFDEMITGFRIHVGGAQAWFGVQADISTYGKVIGGGLPIGVIAGKAAFLDAFDGGMWNYGDESYPQAIKTIFAGAFFKHPLTMAAAQAVLHHLRDNPSLLPELNERTARLVAKLNRIFADAELPVQIVHFASLFRFMFSPEMKFVDLFFYHMLDQGIYIWEGRNCFLSTAHSEEDLGRIVQAVERSIAEMRTGGFWPGRSGKQPRSGPSAETLTTPAYVVDRSVKPPSARASTVVPKFSLYYFGNYQSGYSADKYELLFEGAKYADEHGFEAVWIPERHFHSFGGFSPNPSVVAAALARATQRICIRAGSVVLPLHNPIRVAEEWSVVDNLSHGRVGISFASGWQPNDFVFAPEAYATRHEHMYRGIEMVQRLWSGEKVTARSGNGKEIKVALAPMPVQRTLPTWLTGVSPVTFTKAGELGTRILTNLQDQSIEELAEKIALYRAAFEANGHDPSMAHVTLLLHTFVSRDLAEARETARPPLYRYMRSSLALMSNRVRGSKSKPINLDEVSSEDLDYILSSGYERYVQSASLIGTIESCVPVVDRVLDIGVNEIACMIDFGIDTRTVLESLRDLSTLRERYQNSTPLLSAGEQRTMLFEWNETSTDPEPTTIPELFDAQADLTPNAVALVSDNRQLNYRQLKSRANQLANYLKDQGVGAESIVGICMNRSLDTIVALLGVLKAGGAYVPLDPSYPRERLSFMISDAQPALVLTHQNTHDVLAELDIKSIRLDADWNQIAAYGEVSPRINNAADNLCYVIYTSGSTGQPKGVLNPHRGAINRCRWMWQEYPFTDGEVCCQKTSLNFVDSVWEIFGPLLRGVSSVVVPEEIANDPLRLVEMLSQQNVTRITLVPSLLRMILALEVDLQDKLPKLQHWTTSGETLTSELVEKFRQRLPHAVLLNLYGSSEVAADVTHWNVLRENGFASVPIGKPIANTQIYLLDSDLQPVPVGATGELYVGGDGLSRGYHKRPDMTAEKFIPSPFAAAGARLYRTGDLARYRSDGVIEYLGRTDHQVQLRGFRIELGEVEAVLNDHKAVKESVVLVREDSPGDPRLVAYVVPNAKAPQYEPLAAEGNKDVRAIPLTDAQRQLWVTTQIGPDASRAYNESVTLKMRGPFDPDAMRRALAQLIERHEQLRATFSADGEYEFIHPSMSIDIPLVDFSDVPENAREAEAEAWITRAVGEPFDLERGPLVRFTIIKMDRDFHLLLFNNHHLVSDGQSWPVLLKDLEKLYSAARLGVAPQLQPPRRFDEYVNRLHKIQSHSDAHTSEEYWLKLFRDSVPVLRLPNDKTRPPVQTYNGKRVLIETDASLFEKVKRICAAQGATLYMTLLAAYSALLHRLSGQHKIIVGVPAAGQLAAGCKDTVGYCVNLMPLLSDASGNPAFVDYLATIKRTLMESLEHQHYNFGSLLERLDIPRDASRSPLFTTVFNIDRVGTALKFFDLEMEVTGNTTSWVPFELRMNLLESEDQLLLGCTFNTDLFYECTIRRWMGYFQTLLHGVCADPATRVHELPLMSETQVRQVLVTWNNTAAEQPAAEGFHRLFEAQADSSPESVAVVVEDEHLSYRDLNVRANRLARYLRRRGIGPEIPVALYLERSADVIVALLAVMKAGGVYVPLDPTHPPERLHFALTDCGARIVLTHDQRRKALEGCDVELICLDTQQSEWSRESGEDLEGGAGPSNLTYLIYTSGSTGKPKGVGIEHRQLLNYVCGVSQSLSLPKGGKFATVSTLAADLGHTMIFPALSGGGTLHLITQDRLTNPDALASYFERHQIDCLKVVPSHLEALLMARHPKQVLPRQRLILGGEVAQPGLLSRLAEFEPVCEVFNHYGPTEATVGVLTFHVPKTRLQAPAAETAALPLGHPIANTRVYVLDAYGQPVPPGIYGELYVGGAGVTRGYHNQPELTAERFVPDPFSGERGARLYRTGDVCRHLPDGEIEFAGRTDNQVKISGQRIEPGEIEVALGDHRAVREAVVVARNNTPGERGLVAYVVAQRGASASVSELREHLRRRLPPYMQPAAFVMLDKMPLTPNGKIDRQALPAPDATRPEMDQEYEQPRTITEEWLAQIWSEVLRIQHLGVHDNFFDLGGNSLLGTKVTARVRDRFQVQLTLRNLFESPTIAQLSALIVARQATPEAAGPEALAAPRTSVDQLLSNVDHLPETEVDSLLQALLAEEEAM